MRVAFYSPHLCLRGTTVAMYDYAHHNETLLGNESLILFHTADNRNDASAMLKFSKRFKCIGMNGLDELDKTLESERAEAVYIIKGGRNDGVVARSCRSLIHCIACVNDPHGDRYAYGSYWLSDTLSGGSILAVPYMIDLPNLEGDLRAALSIPKDAIVLGRNGGMDSWNIRWANDAVINAVHKRDDLYFVFQNTPRFYAHPRIIHIPSSADLRWKVLFIQTCDAMIHAREEGESFGLSCGEFSSKNKPIITYGGSPERSHISILGDNGIYYRTQHEMEEAMIEFQRASGDWNCYRDYVPAKVMPIFKRVFLD